MTNGPEHTPLPINPVHLTNTERRRDEFLTGDPFPHLVLDDFLDDELARALTEEFPSIDAMPRSRDYVFGNKHELSSVEQGGPASRRFHDAVLSPPFAALLEAITGMTVFIDPAFHGGGFHQGGDGSYLDFHVDFNLHPLHDDWLRRLNILVYLTPDWRDDYGGHLLIKSSPDSQPRAIAPTFNRAVIMLSDEFTFHGYRKLSLPDGVTRRSIATYAYGENDGRTSHTTNWVPEDAGLAKKLFARNYNSLVRVKNRLFGSGTAKNR
jgi:hypothetical protein